MRNPLVSVIMPVYNGEKFISEAIESILNQTYQNWELIIVNDGSTDKTREIIYSFMEDKRVRYYEHTNNQGQAMAYNTGYLYSQGKYVAVQDSDDVSIPERLEKEVTILEENIHCKFVFSPAIFVDVYGNTISVWKVPLREGFYDSSDIFYNIYINGNFVPNSSLLIRRPVLKYITKFKIVNDFFSNLQYIHDYPVFYVRKPVIKIRRGDSHNSLSSKKGLLFREERIVLYDIYKLYTRHVSLPVTSSVYRKAMSIQLRKEGWYFMAKGYRMKGKLLSIKSFFYTPFSKRALVFMIENCFPSKIVKFMVRIKRFLYKKVCV